MKHSQKIGNLRNSRNSSIKRKNLSKRMYSSVLIVCEGQNTEINYFKGLISRLGIQTNVDVKTTVRGSSPDNVLNSARKVYCKNNDYDYVFCVFDKDRHDKYQETLDALQTKAFQKYKAANSVPCFEFWLLLHHKFTTAPCYSSKDPVQKVINQLKEFAPSYSKADSQDFSEYYELTDKAILNATKVLDEANNNGTDDPSTHIHELVILLKDLASKINS